MEGPARPQLEQEAANTGLIVQLVIFLAAVTCMRVSLDFIRGAKKRSIVHISLEMKCLKRRFCSLICYWLPK